MEKNLTELREHIRAVEQTRQITNAMYLLSAAQMKRIMPHIDYNREYFNRIRSAVKDILSRTGAVDNTYLTARPIKRAGYLVIASDKGMAGPYNHNLLEFAWKKMQQYTPPGAEMRIATIGLHASDFFVKKGLPPEREYLGMAQNPSMENARMLRDELFALYDSGQVDEITMLYTRFISSAVQYPRAVRLLPLSVHDYQNITVEYEYDLDMIYHPSPEVVFSELVPQYVVGLLYGAMAQSFASEHCSRMNAMQSATRNADDLIKRLQHAYNGARQLRITQELTETVASSLIHQ